MEVVGEGVADPKAIFGTTKGLVQKYGPDRVIEMPVAENGLTGVAIGSALLLHALGERWRPDLVPLDVMLPNLDGLSILLVLLTTFLTPISILSTWTAVEERVKDFMIFFLLLKSA